MLSEATKQSKPNIPAAVARDIVNFLRDGSVAGILARGQIAEAQQKFGYHRNTIHHVWQRRNSVYNRKKGATKGKTKRDISSVQQLVKSVSLRLRQNIRALAHAIDVPKSTIGRYLREKTLKVGSAYVRPALSDANRTKRLDFVLSFVYTASVEGSIGS